jgi:hypothetical protein
VGPAETASRATTMLPTPGTTEHSEASPHYWYLRMTLSASLLPLKSNDGIVITCSCDRRDVGMSRHATPRFRRWTLSLEKWQPDSELGTTPGGR